MLTEEDSVKEILLHLSKINKEKALNLSQHYGESKEKYGDVLKKLAE